MRGSKAPALALGAAATLSLAGCGGGGSPSGAVTTPIATPTPVQAAVAVAAPTPTPAPLVTPSVSSAEYKRNPALALMHVDAAWAAGATGAGQTIAIIDTAVDASSFDLAGKVSADSVDLVSSRSATDTPGRHGTQVAGVIAANFNGVGTVGAAYNAKILSIRADAADSCATECSFGVGSMARGVDYAVGHGAKIINLSLGDSSSNGSYFEAALKRAVDAGAVIVAAAGNEGDPDPIYPARYAIDPRFKGAVIAAGALNATGSDIASFSNRAGVAADGYLLAPGQSIRTDCDASGQCAIVAGTSFAAPHIAADLALLLEAFPNLTGRQAVDILLRTATDMGPSGVDAAYGRGQVNMAKAMQPVGALSVQSASGSVYQATSVAGAASTAALSAAFGDVAFAQGLDLHTVGFDAYRRLYKVDLGGSITAAGRRSSLAPAFDPAEQSSIDAALPDGAQLRLSARRSMTPVYVAGGMAGMALAQRSDAMMINYAVGPMRFDLWTGKAGFAPAEATAGSDPYSSLAFASQTARFGYRAGAWTFSAEQGFGGRQPDALPDFIARDHSLDGQGSLYARGVAAFQGRAWTAALTAGVLSEPGGPLGSSAAKVSAVGLPASTRYLQAELGGRLLPGLALTARASAGDTRAAGAALALKARSLGWSVQADAVCTVLCSGVSFSLGQPVRVQSGELSAYLADAPAAYLDPLTYSRRRVSIDPSGRELDFGVGVWRDLAQAGVVRLQANAFSQEANRRDAPLNLDLTASWARRF